MAAINDLFASLLGKQDAASAKLDEIKSELDAQKALISERDSRISALTAEVDKLKASIVEKDGALTAAAAALETEKAEHKATAESVDAKAALKASEISQTLGHTPVESTPSDTPAAPPLKDLSKLVGIARVKADIARQLETLTK